MGGYCEGRGGASSRRRPMGIWGRNPSRRTEDKAPSRRKQGSEDEAPALGNFLQSFNKNNAFLGIFRLKFLL